MLSDRKKKQRLLRVRNLCSKVLAELASRKFWLMNFSIATLNETLWAIVEITFGVFYFRGARTRFAIAASGVVIGILVEIHHIRINTSTGTVIMQDGAQSSALCWVDKLSHVAVPQHLPSRKLRPTCIAIG